MYSYYLFSALGERYQRFLWWKKYLTALQMVSVLMACIVVVRSPSVHDSSMLFPLLQVQFVAIMVHAFQLLFIDCNYPRAFVWWIGMHAVMFFFLFNEFYKSTYKFNALRRLEALRNKIEAANGTNGTNGLASQYYDSINHNSQHHINNNKKEYSSSQYGANTSDLVNRKKVTVQN